MMSTSRTGAPAGKLRLVVIDALVFALHELGCEFELALAVGQARAAAVSRWPFRVKEPGGRSPKKLHLQGSTDI